MPVSFQFSDKVTHDGISISRIDDEIAEYINQPINEKYALYFDEYGSLGISILLKSSGSVVDEDSFNDYFDSHPELIEYIDSAREFLLDRYRFSAWRSPK